MYLVDYIDAILQIGGRKINLITNIAYAVNTVVGRRIHLKNVGSRADVYGTASLTFATRIAVTRIQSVDSFGKYFCTACLTRSTRAAKKIGVAELICLGLIFEDTRYVVLSAHLIKVARTPFSV